MTASAWMKKVLLLFGEIGEKLDLIVKNQIVIKANQTRILNKIGEKPDEEAE